MYPTGSNSSQGNAVTFTIYSTQRGRPAVASGDFPAHLNAALRGHGRAKAWRKADMYVHYDSVVYYLRAKMTQQLIDGDRGGVSEGLILQIKPVPRPHCTVMVDKAASGDNFDLLVENAKGQRVGALRSFQGPRFDFDEVPEDYVLTVSHASATVVPVEPPLVELFEDRTVHFIKQPATSGVSPPPPFGPPLATVKLQGSPRTRLALHDLTRGGTEISPLNLTNLSSDLTSHVPPGPYLVKMIDTGGMTLRSIQIVLTPGETLNLNLGRREKRPLLDAILQHVPGHDESAVDFSETLGGPVADPDPGLWLALLGASRIVADPNSFSKLSKFALRTFNSVQRDGACVYVLAGFDQPTNLTVAIRELGSVGALPPVPPSPVVGVSGLYDVSRALKASQNCALGRATAPAVDRAIRHIL